jgi:hypothetical protein
MADMNLQILSPCGQKVLKVLQVMTATESSGGAVDLTNSYELFVQAIRGAKAFTLDDVMVLLDSLSGSSFDIVQKQALCDMVNQKVYATISTGACVKSTSRASKAIFGSTCNNDQQINEFVFNYLTPDVLKLFKEQSKWDEPMFDGIAIWLDHIGCTLPDSKTCRAVYATWVVVQANGRKPQADAVHCVAQIHRMSEYLKKYRRYSCGAQPHHRRVWQFPEKPTDLIVNHKDVYDHIFNSFEPIELKVDTDHIKQLCRFLPCRSSHADFRGGIGDTKRSGRREAKLHAAARRAGSFMAALSDESDGGRRRRRGSRRSRSRRRHRRRRERRRRRRSDSSDYSDYSEELDRKCAGRRGPLALTDAKPEHAYDSQSSGRLSTPTASRHHNSQCSAGSADVADDDLFGFGGSAAPNITIVQHGKGYVLSKLRNHIV